MKTFVLSVLAAASLAAALPAAAQTAPTPPAPMAQPGPDHAMAPVDRREVRQDQRINDAERKGEMSPRQAHRLHHRIAMIRRHEHRMRLHHHGRLTHHERHVLNKRLNHTGHTIGKHEG